MHMSKKRCTGFPTSRQTFDSDRPSKPIPPATCRHCAKGTRILLADDNADMRGYVRRLLARSCDVQTVADGQEALEAIRAKRPDLILTDVMMPNLDGFGLLRAIRSDADLREIPVIMLSARAGEESRVEGLEAGADDYLVKPFSARELIARVSSLLELDAREAGGPCGAPRQRAAHARAVPAGSGLHLRAQRP